MAKIEEIVGLMTEEIAEFRTSVEKLAEINKKLSQMKVKLDLDDVKNTLTKNLEEQNKKQERCLCHLQEVVTKTVDSQEQPRWMIISKLSLALLSLLFVSYSIYKISSIPDIEKAAYDKGQEQVLTHVKKFLSENKDASHIYNEWLTKSN
ncbi:hypothetical protein C8P64_0480 [Christiangramia gaetbulicola]|uniref:Uncharacterized protein n=1 Tax=Christiangramia gaetbulicola TaxID=703340 RepID=A0A2T6AL07_9FLAO|nr:DUF6730 family protein [Christiangramia gaetbulicola]PTX44501.1 hypothetical protein C8P64_0480 [Christiangramia gaetbulicola]